MDKIPVGQDHGQFIWNCWWVKHSIFNLNFNYLYTDYLIYPYGASLTFSTISELNSFISIPFQTAFGVLPAYNLLIIFNFVLSGVSTYLLVKYLTKSKISALVSGFIYSFSPYLINRIFGGHLNMISVGWIPLFVLFLIKTFKEPNKKNAFLASLFLLFTFLSSWQYGLITIVFTFFYILFKLLFDRKEIISKKKLLYFGLFIVIFFILISPFLIPKINEINKNSNIQLNQSISDQSYLSLDFLSPITPSYTQAITKDLSLKPESFGVESFSYWEDTGYIGFTVILIIFLSFIFLFKKQKEMRFWFFSLFLFFIFSLGPILKIMGNTKFTDLGFSIPLPYILLRNYFPFFSISRGASRLIVIVVLSTSVIVGYALKEFFNNNSNFLKNGFTFLLNKFNSKYIKRNINNFFKIIIFLLLISLIFFEYNSMPIRFADIHRSDFYYEISKDNDDYAIADIPRGIEAITMYYQTVHEKKITGGQISRPIDAKFLFIENQALRALYWLELDKFNITREDLIEMKDLNIKFLVVHKHVFWDAKMSKILDEIRVTLDKFFYQSYFEDENFLVYNLFELS